MDSLDVMIFVRNWFKAINDQAPARELLGMLSTQGFELKFPEATLTDEAGFNAWYDNVRASFFDQNHIIRHLDIQPAEDEAELAVWVNWQARTRPADKAQSQVLDFDAIQRWTLRRENGGWAIGRYEVVELFDNLKPSR